MDTTRILYKEKLFGNILVSLKIIDEEQLFEALEHQATNETKLGEALMTLGYASEGQIAQALASQFGLPYVELNKEVPKDVIKLIPKDIAQRYAIVPVKKLQGAIRVAIADPLDLTTVDDLRLILNCDVECALATASNINQALQKYYPRDEEVSETSEHLPDKTPEVSGISFGEDSMGVFYTSIHPDGENSAVSVPESQISPLVDKIEELVGKFEQATPENTDKEISNEQLLRKELEYQQQLAFKNYIIIALATLCLALLAGVIFLAR